MSQEGLDPDDTAPLSLAAWGALEEDTRGELVDGRLVEEETGSDRIDKLRDYAAFGVPYYWLLDPELQTLEILELAADGRYVHALDASAGRLEPIPGCEGLVIDLDALWREVATLESGDDASRSHGRDARGRDES